MIEAPIPLTRTSSNTPEELGVHIWDEFKKLRDKRAIHVEKRWDMFYMLYRGTPEDMARLRDLSKSTGETKDWKHKISSGKGFETIETLVSYLVGATFPTDDWFGVDGLVPELAEQAKVIKQLAKNKMLAGSLPLHVEDHYRQLCIYGFSTLRVSWKSCMRRKLVQTPTENGLTEGRWVIEDNETLQFDTISPYDVWVTGNPRILEGGTYIRLRPTYQELSYLVDEGYYTINPDLLEKYEEDFTTDTTKNRDSVGEGRSPVTITEFYGPVLYNGTQYDVVHAVFFNHHLIRLTNSEYGCGNPYIPTRMLPDRDSIYGMSILDPAAGLLHTLNIVGNSRLDALVIFIEKMFTMVDDGILDIDDVFTAPGKIFKVADHNSLRPMDMGNSNFTVSYQEAATLESNIDRITSTGPLIGGGQPRGGERVTASEITAVQQSGGNRLSTVYNRIELAFLVPLLSKVFDLLQQYFVTPEIVRVYAKDMQLNAFYNVLPEYLSYPYEFQPMGAAYIVEKQRQLSDVMNLMDVASRAPEMAQQLDYSILLEEILAQMRFKNPSRFLKAPAAPAPDMAPTGPPPAPDMGGELMQQGIGTQIQADGGAGLLQGVGVDTQDIPPDQLSALTTNLQTQAP
jgi:hypothetical protein